MEKSTWIDAHPPYLDRLSEGFLRVAELLERSARRTDYTVERLIEMIIEDRNFARENGQAAAAGAATERLAKVLGMWVDRKEVREVSELEAINDPEELRAKLIKMAREMGEDGIADAMEGKPH